MFIEIEGHLLNPEHIVEVTPEGAIALTSGSTVHVKDAAELSQLRTFLAQPCIDEAPEAYGDEDCIPTVEETHGEESK